MHVLRRSLVVTSALIALTAALSACGSSGPTIPAGFSHLPVVMSGGADFGSYDIREEPSGKVLTDGPWGVLDIRRSGARMSGDDGWGSISLVLSHAHISGNAGGGNLSSVVTDTRMSGSTGWGGFSIKLKGQILSGSLPFGSISFRIASRFHSLLDWPVLMATLLVLSDKE